jgi:Protein of unknown function (DUF2628)
MEENPYQSPRFDGPSDLSEFLGPPPGETAISEAEARAFVGKKADYYLRKWGPALELGGPVHRFNGPAFLFSGFWIPYRKMYRVYAIIFGIIAADMVLEATAVGMGWVDEKTLDALGRLIALGFSILWGVLANDWYLAHMRREIARIRSLGLPDDAYFAALARRGGTSVLAGVGLFCLFLTGLFLVLFALEFFLFTE